jgi:hypothetical protein
MVKQARTWVLRMSGTENTLKPPSLIRQNQIGIRDFLPHRFAEVKTLATGA